MRPTDIYVAWVTWVWSSPLARWVCHIWIWCSNPSELRIHHSTYFRLIASWTDLSLKSAINPVMKVPICNSVSWYRLSFLHLICLRCAYTRFSRWVWFYLHFSPRIYQNGVRSHPLHSILPNQDQVCPPMAIPMSGAIQSNLASRAWCDPW
jgi:hypothetical protein